MGSISKIFPESVCSLLPQCLQYQPDRIVFHWPVSCCCALNWAPYLPLLVFSQSVLHTASVIFFM